MVLTKKQIKARNQPRDHGKFVKADGASKADVPKTIIDLIDRCYPEFNEPSWRAWRAFLKALFALDMSDEERAIYARFTGRESTPHAPFDEAWVVVGRRGGKSRIMALVVVLLAMCREYDLAQGEMGLLMVLAKDKKQARIVKRYTEAMLSAVPDFKKQIVGDPKLDRIELEKGITIEITASHLASVRGYTIVGAVCDEIAFWPTDDAANPDEEVLNAIRPGMATVEHAMLLCISSPYARRGELWRTYKRYFGKDEAQDADGVLVWQAPTLEMNPLPKVKPVVERAYARDPASAAAEYGAEFRTDVEGVFNQDALDACIATGVRERPYVPGLRYMAFVDPSGGSNDEMVLAIAHAERHASGDPVHVLDLVRPVKPPCSPERTVKEFVDVMRAYRLKTVIGDRYGAEWTRERFRMAGVAYVVADKPKSELYLSLLPLVNSRRADLLDDAKLYSQLVGLERRVGRGRDSIDHAPGAHDDVANAAAGALVYATRLARQVVRGAGEPAVSGLVF